MKKIIFMLYCLITLLPLYSHGGDQTTQIRNRILFGDEDRYMLKEIDVSNWDFSEKEIYLDTNENYRLIFTVKSGHHGIQIRGLDLKSGNLDDGEQVIWDLESPEKGEYAFYCYVPCGGGHSTMKGTIIVE